MELKEMTIEQLEERKAQIVEELDKPEADLDALENEARSIKEEIEARKAEHAKKEEIRKEVANGAGEVKESLKETNNMKDIKEFRNSAEYSELYADYLKSGDDTEIRAALLSTNATNGTIAVPDYVHEIVKTAWDENDIMSLVERVSYPGNYVVNFEISGTDAVIHTEGGQAVAEEDLVEGIVTLIPEYAKKWKSFSKTVYALRGEAFVRYIYNEIAHRIVKAIADDLINKIATLPQTATSTSPSAAKITAAPAVGTVAQAAANLSDEANDPTIIMNKLTWGAFKAAQYAANYAADPFEGFRVRFSTKLPDYATATSGQVYMIVGDLRHGAIANFPNGESVEYTFDTLSRKKENLVEVLGELMVAAGPVADKAFALVAKA